MDLYFAFPSSTVILMNITYFDFWQTFSVGEHPFFFAIMYLQITNPIQHIKLNLAHTTTIFLLAYTKS